MKKPNRSLWQCSMAALLSFSMITAQVPAVAFAEEGQPTEENQVVQGGQPIEGQDVTLGEIQQGNPSSDGGENQSLEGEGSNVDRTLVSEDVANQETNKRIAPVPTWMKSFWPAFRGGDKNNVVNMALPTTNGELDWVADVENTNVSELITVDANVYVAAGNVIFMVSGFDGRVIARATLEDAIVSGAQLSYSEGLISVPLVGDKVQRVYADTLETYVEDEPTVERRAAIVEAQAEAEKSFSLNKNRVIVAKDGKISFIKEGDANASVETTIGENIDLSKSIKVSDSIIVTVSEDGKTLRKFEISADGAIAETKTVDLKAETSVPTEANDKVYVGTTGGLKVVDKKTLDTKVITKAVKADGVTEEAIPGNVVSSPLVATHDGSTWVYFTSNANPGAVYSYCDGGTVANVLFEPMGDEQGASTCSVVPTEDGGVVYANASGTVFKVIPGLDVAPTVTVDEASAKGIEKGQTSTFTIKQVISKDATSVKISMEIPEEMEYVSKDADITVTQNGKKVGAAVSIDGRKLTVDVTPAEVLSLRDKEIQFEVKAKVKENADLSKYEAPLAYAVPVRVTTQFNGDEARMLTGSAVVIVNKAVTPEDLNPAPTMSTDKGDNPISRTDEVTFTISQKVPEDATSVVTWHTMEPVLHYTSKVEDIVVRVKDGDVLGRDVAAVNLEGQKLTVTIKDGDAKSTTEEAKSEDTSAESKDTENKESERKDAESKETTDSSKALESQGEDTTSEQATTDQKSDAKDNAEATTDDATETTGSTSSTHATDLRGKTIEVTFKGKINDDAKLDAYLNAAGNVASIPYQATTQFNEDDQRVVKSEVKSLKVSVGSSNSGSATNRTATATTGTTTRTTTPSTGDESVQVTWIIVAAIAVILVAVALRLRAARKKE